jgi:hypothetical protein
MRTLLVSLVAVAMLTGTAWAQSAHKTQTKSTLTANDQLQIAVQKICPVMGGELGSMGDPIKVQMGSQFVYLCCKGCVGKQAKAEHWKTIQANIAKAQGTCPIMGKAVTPDMKSTVVNGQQVFVCCPPCIDKIQADPKAALTKVNASYVSFVKSKSQLTGDQAHIAAQGICPVSGQKLGAMGDPIKVQVGEEYAFLCCKGCQGKQLDAKHWATVQANLAKAQGTCPVMGKPVTADMKSVVVIGRKIFVCCPPCIDKIKADPVTYIAKLDSQIASRVKGQSTANAAGHEGHDHSQHKH